MSMPIAYDEHDACKSSSWGAQRININIFDPCVWRVLADCCYPEKMRRGWTLAWAPTQLLQVEIQARPVSIVNCQFSETFFCSSSGSTSTTNLTSNFPNPANIDIIINTCEVKRSQYLFLWVFDNPSAINVIINTFFARAINFWVMILFELSGLVNDVFPSIPKKYRAFRRHQFGPGVVNIYKCCCNIPLQNLIVADNHCIDERPTILWFGPGQWAMGIWNVIKLNQGKFCDE